MKIIRTVALFMVVVLLSSCKRQVIPPDDVELGKEYFPLTRGHSVEYDVDSIKYNDFNKTIDSFHYEIKDVIQSEFLDNEGRKSYIINRFKRQDNTYPWAENVTYYITETAFNIEVIEDNLRMIKMVFPVKANTKWDGNIFLPTTLIPELKWLSGWNYEYVNINQSHNTSFLNFDNTVTVEEVDVAVGDSLDTDNYSARTYSREIYAKNVGLIQRELVNWEFQSTTTKYRNGFVIIYRAKKVN